MVTLGFDRLGGIGIICHLVGFVGWGVWVVCWGGWVGVWVGLGV